MPEAVVQQRIVPGAPPPAPLSKSQKKKRRTKAGGKSENDDTAPGTPEVNVASAPLLEKAPEPSEVNEGSIAPELIARTESQGATLPEEDVLLKPSPIVDLVYKRLKVTTKKISRITIYAATDPEKLNDDQKRTLKTLPTLEAIQKELSEVKKAIETHEADLVQELAVKRHEADKAEKARIASAVSSAETALVSKTNTLLDIIRLRSSLASGLDITSIADATEITAIISAADALVSEDEARKQAAVESILLGRDFEGVGSSRLLEITQLAYNPPRAPTPPPEEPVAEEQPAEPVVEPQVEEEHPVIGIPPSTTTGSFRFMQDSEIEASNTNFEEEAEWVEKSDAVGHDAPSVNGHASQEAVLADAGPIDWAADEEAGLPSIAGLQAEFGTSGSVTPAEVPEARIQPEAVAPSPAVNGGASSTAEHAEDDGFTQAKSRGRGRGSGFRGEGRGGRGGYRGGDRGGYRGGERGGFRGDRGNYRGGEGRGGFRGGERGNFRGGERGGFRGGEGRGRGEWRGEGRGRGRGRGGPPGTPTTPAPAA